MADPITRSGSNYSVPRDSNRVPMLIGVSTVDGITPVPLEVNPSNGQLQVSGGGGGGLSVVDEASWTAGTSDFTPTGGFFNDAATALTSGQQGTVRMTPDRSLYTANSQPANSSATWTTSTSINTTLAQSTVGLGTATVTTIETGTTTTAGALTFEVYDGTNWWAVTGQQIGSYTIQSSYTLVNGTNVSWQFDVAGFQQFRVRLSTAITGTGSPQVVVILQTQGAANDITPTVGWGQRLDQTNDAITNYPFGHSYLNIAAGQATTTVKSGAGVLLAIVYNSAATATSTMVIYDNTAASGTKIGTVAATAIVGPESVPYGLAFNTGLTIITGTANGADMTIIYR